MIYLMLKNNYHPLITLSFDEEGIVLHFYKIEKII